MIAKESFILTRISKLNRRSLLIKIIAHLLRGNFPGYYWEECCRY
jgi:hypothetical protein